ncbi:hypothetical protein HMPREF1208_01660 [Staphylococcus sp. HGB0015]|uniref:CAAX amino terminal protease family protein n=2 Tax=Staphylococcus TaxID=1279 RepID=A0A7Z7QMF8_STASC|nr:CPBP family intramembrane glutamic endopeptidase [Staphylococcus schleiferi]EPD49312.1 hypothetical protein HMPREF1208_01660 [Staphylococcus sp. HGB0015]QGS46460.1 CPBP family intramembrane metalloprotease [Mammaliicoccus fleurettii]RTX79346.1 CPBP family intramembrane metalloprotease [Staphylococcus schleiferi subsp. schleiferi]NHA33158.1 CPBP family intramembrane metalloprotease [Staphylococcus schleiferi]NHA39404.1 CPBP family intramembrane metalloprotease [Staphylococcus schleiferi]
MLIEAVFIGGIVAPIVEEMMFRGVLLQYIEVKTNRVWAIGITSALFGFIYLFIQWQVSRLGFCIINSWGYDGGCHVWHYCVYIQFNLGKRDLARAMESHGWPLSDSDS